MSSPASLKKTSTTPPISPLRKKQSSRRSTAQTGSNPGGKSATESAPVRSGLKAAAPVAPTRPATPAVLEPVCAAAPFDSEKTISVKEAAFRLRKSEDAIRRWLRRGRLRGFQPGGRSCSVLVLESSVEQARFCAVGGAIRG